MFQVTYLNPDGYPIDAELSLNPFNAKGLADLMSEISEDQWCAGWLDGAEYSLWSMVDGGETDWGFGKVDPSSVALLRRLSESCGGWIVWTDDRCERWIPMSEWLPMYESQQKHWAQWQAKFNETEP